MPDIGLSEVVNTAGTVAGVGETAKLATDTLAGKGFLGKLLHRGINPAQKPTAKPHPFEPRKPQTAGPTSSAMELRTSAITERIAGLPTVGEDGKLQEGVSAEKFNISEVTVNGFVGLTDRYVRSLIRLQSLPSHPPIVEGGKTLSRYEQMKREQAESGNIRYVEDDLMLQLFANNDSKTNEYTVKTPEEITALITKHKDDLLGTLLIVEERYIRDIQSALGIRTGIRGGGKRPDPTKNKSTDIVGQGPLRVVKNKIGEFLSTPEGQAIAAMAGAEGTAIAAGAAIAGPVGAGVAGLAVAGVEAALVLYGEGYVLDIKPAPEARNQSATPAEITRAREMLGIDPDNPQLSRGLDEARKLIRQIVYHRAGFLTECGVQPKNLDAFSDSFVYLPALRPESNSLSIYADLDSYYRDLGGLTAATSEARIDIIRQAQEKLLTRNLERVWKIEKGTGENRIDILSKQIQGYREGGSTLATKTKEATEEKERLGAERTGLEGDRTALRTFRDKAIDIQRQRRALEKTLSGIRSGATGYNSAEEAIDAITAVMDDPATTTTITIVLENGRTMNISNIATRTNTAREHQKNLYDTISGWIPNPGESLTQFAARQTLARTAADTAFEQEMAPVNRDKQQLEAAITRLETKAQEIRTLDENALSSQEVTAGAKALVEFISAQRTLATDWGIPQATIDSGDYGSILTAIHNANTTDPTHGWPATEKEDNQPDHRLIIRRAMVQARANTLARTGVPNPSAVEPNYASAIDLGFSPEQLITLSLEELERRSADLSPAGTATPKGELQNAQLWAREQLRYIQESLNQEGIIVQNLERVQQRTIESVDSKTRINQLEMVKTIHSSTEQIYSRAFGELSPTETADALISDVPLSLSDFEYTQPEAASGLPRNVLEIIQILTNYQNEPDRGTAFQEIWKNLGENPDLLLRFFNNAFADQLAPTVLNSPLGITYTPMQEFALRLNHTMQIDGIRRTSFADTVSSKLVDEFWKWSRTT